MKARIKGATHRIIEVEPSERTPGDNTSYYAPICNKEGGNFRQGAITFAAPTAQVTCSKCQRITA